MAEIGLDGATQDGRFLKVTTALGDNKLLINGFSGEEAISELFCYRLTLLALADPPIPTDDLMKLLVQPASLLMAAGAAGGSPHRYFHGIVSRITRGPTETSYLPKVKTSLQHRYREYRVEVVPWLWLLTHKTDSRIFQEKSAVEIIKIIFDEFKSEFSFVDYVDKTTTNRHIKLDYCVQYRESSFNFVSRLMEQEGIFYYFTHEEKKHTLVLADSNTKDSLPACAEPSKITYELTTQPKGREIITFLEQQLDVRPGKYTLRDDHFRLPKNFLEVSVQGVAEMSQASPQELEIYDYPGGYTAGFNLPTRSLSGPQPYENAGPREEGEKLARIRIEQKELYQQSFEGISTCKNLASGKRFTLLGNSDVAGEFIVTKMNYIAGQKPNYLSGQNDDKPFENHFVCLPSKVTIRPLRVTDKPLVSGPQTAFVTAAKGEDSFLDEFGRVRVLFPWDRKPNDRNPESNACWIRVAQSWAGTGWGAHFWPREGQEVVVEFLEGDPDRPLITGSVYGPANMPPYALPANYTRSGVKTRTAKSWFSADFNEWRFEDKPGAEQIFFRAKRDMDQRVDNDLREWVGNNQHVHIKGEQRVQIEGKMSLHVQGERHEKVDKVLTLEATEEIHLKAGKIVIEAGSEVCVKGPGGFMDIAGSGVFTQGTVVKVNQGGSATDGAKSEPDSPDTADDGSKGGKL